MISTLRRRKSATRFRRASLDHRGLTAHSSDNQSVLTFLKDELVFLHAQGTQSSADHVIIRRGVALTSDSINVVQEAERGQKVKRGTEGTV